MTSTEVDYSITFKTNGPGTYSLVSGCPPFATGTWTLEVLEANVLDAIACRLSWTGVTDAVYTTNVSVPISYAAPGPAQLVYTTLLTRFIGTDGAFPSTLPAGGTGFTVSPNALDARMSSLTFKFSLDPSNQPFKLKPDPTPTNVFAARSTVQVDAAVPNDVRLYFPSCKRELWSSVAILSAASPYFKTLFSSGFTEAEMKVHVGTAEEEDVAMDDGIDEEDSDAETDRTLVKKLDVGVRSERSSAAHGSLPFHDVIIKDTSFTTYRSVLVWIYSRHIAFSPLTSTFGGDRGVRHLKIEEMSKATSHLPLPASPKSVYRLAHYLELEALQELALASIKSQITVKNVAEELFSRLGRTDAEVQKMELNFAIANWDKVKLSKGMKAVQGNLASGKLDHTAGSVFALLALRLS